jgi:ribosomal protein L16/L10AE
MNNYIPKRTNYIKYHLNKNIKGISKSLSLNAYHLITTKEGHITNMQLKSIDQSLKKLLKKKI